MHNLASALKNKGFVVSGSDDEIFEPSKSRLAEAGLLPQEWGWFPEKLGCYVDAVILGMHARADNPGIGDETGNVIENLFFPGISLRTDQGQEKSGNCRKSWQNHHNLHDSSCAEAGGKEVRLYGGFAD